MKNWIIGVLALTCVVLGIILYFKLTQTIDTSVVKITEAAKKTVDAEVNNIKNNIGKNGFFHAVGKDKEQVIKSASELNDSSQYWFNKYTEQLGINEKQAKLLVTANATIKAHSLDASRSDTGFFYSDKYARIEYVRAKDSLGNGHFNFSYNADINYAEYWKRDWFLGKKKHYFDFFIADTRATINGMKRIRVEAKQPSIKMDVNATGFYTDRLNIGADAGIHFGRLRLGGGYFFDLQEREWRPAVSAKLKILEF